jgi:hypothetical protein
VTFTDEASGYQVYRITRLLDERAVTGKVAARIIQMLEDAPEKGNAMGHNADIAKAVKDRVTREDK